MKRIMCLLLALVMVFSLVGVSAFADETEEPAEEAEEEVEETTVDDGFISVTFTGATEGLYSQYSSFDNIISLNDWYSVYLKPGYDIEVTDGTLGTSGYWVDSEGNVVRYRQFIVYSDSAPDEVIINVVASSDEAPTAVYVTAQLPSGATAESVISYANYDVYVLSDSSDSVDLYGGYALAETDGIEITNSGYGIDNYTGEMSAYYWYTVTGETSEATLNIVEDPDAPTAVYTTVKLPDGASAEDVVYSEPWYYNEYTMSGNSDSIWLYGGYALGETAGIEIEDSWYWVDSEGQVYVYYYYTLTGETSEVELNIVEDEDAPYAIKITYAGDLADEYGTDYMLSTEEWINVSILREYDITSVTNAEVKIWSGDNDLVIYPNEGATEIVITGTKKAAGTLKVTGATDQVVSILKYDDEAGKYVAAAEGDTVEADTDLCVTLKQGYVIEEYSSYYHCENGETEFYVRAADILSDGTATLNVVEGVVLVYAGDVENGCADDYRDGYTYVVDSGYYNIYVSTNYGYVADVDGGEVTEVYYSCNTETGEVRASYYITPTSAGTITVTFREAEEDELPASIKVEYTGETDGLSSGAAYVMPGNYFWLYLENGYTAEVTGATYSYYYSYWNEIDFTIDEDATAVTVNIIKIAEESTLKVVGGTDVTDAEAQEAVIKTDDTVADGDALESGVNTIRVANGYEIEAVDGAVYYENGYVTDYDGNIYLEYVLVPTGDPAEVTITVGLVVEWVTVNLVNDTEYFANLYSDNMKTTDSGKQCLSTDTIYVSVYGNNTIKVTGGTVVYSEVYSNSSYFRVEINEGVTEVTVEIISVDDLTAEQAEVGYIDSTNDPDQQNSGDNGGDKPDDKPDSKPDAKPDGEPGGASGEVAPNTGDESNVTLWAILTAALAATTGAVLTLAKKKNN